MSKHIMRTLLFLSTLMLTPAADAAGLQDPQPDLARVQEVLTHEIRKILAETGIPSISLALVRGDSVVWARAFGYANARTKTPATVESYYSTGSTFKFVTATALMQLVEAGKASLDDPVNAFLGDLAIADADSVTMRHILSHYSGLVGPVTTVPIWERRAPMSPEELIAKIRVTRAPGVQFDYCNACYALAGYLVEKISGQSYDQYVAEHVFEPLGIANPAPSVPTPALVEQMALPYNLAANRPTPVAQVRYDVYAAGDIYLTPSDMARFLGAQLNEGAFNGGRILSPESVREMRRVQFGNNYGLGTGSTEQNGARIIAHSGGIPGFNSMSAGDADARVGVYLMSNAMGSGRALAALSRMAISLLRGEAVDSLPSFAAVERNSFELDSEVFDEYVGQYQLNPQFIITVSRVGQRFYVQATGQSRVEIFAESETTFFLTVVDAQLTFERDDAGKVTRLILHQGGADQRAERIN